MRFFLNYFKTILKYVYIIQLRTKGFICRYGHGQDMQKYIYIFQNSFKVKYDMLTLCLLRDMGETWIVCSGQKLYLLGARFCPLPYILKGYLQIVSRRMNSCQRHLEDVARTKFHGNYTYLHFRSGNEKHEIFAFQSEKGKIRIL